VFYGLISTRVALKGLISNHMVILSGLNKPRANMNKY